MIIVIKFLEKFLSIQKIITNNLYSLTRIVYIIKLFQLYSTVEFILISTLAAYICVKNRKLHFLLGKINESAACKKGVQGRNANNVLGN